MRSCSSVVVSAFACEAQRLGSIRAEGTWEVWQLVTIALRYFFSFSLEPSIRVRVSAVMLG